MNVAISSSRTFTDRLFVEKVVARLLARGDFVIIGDAPSGGDRFAFEYLQSVHWANWRRERANWKRWGGYAGHERNGRMIFDAEQLIAIFAPGPRTPGTSDCLSQAVDKGIPAYVFHEGHWLFEGPAFLPLSKTTEGVA